MTRSERGLAGLGACVVVVWLVSYFATVGASAQLAELEAVSVAIAEPPPAPELPSASPSSSAAPAAAAVSAPEPVSERGLALGRELLESGGAFPALNASYERFGSFREYARSMQALGARFVVVKGRKIVASADVERGRVEPFRADVAFSPIPRDYSSEPALAEVARSARLEHGAAARVQMLLPRRLDMGLFGGIAETLEARGEEPASYTEIRGYYEPSGDGRVWFRVESGTRGDGRRVELSRAFDLSSLAAGGGPG